ncbi:MAG: (Fe-S)-binding protein [Deltaproteobacteria bacterium]
MLLTGYCKHIFRPECNPRFQSVHCVAELEDDVSEALPYLNAVLGGFEYIVDPPSVTFKAYGKLITVYGTRIAINALNDEAEAETILRWLKKEINEAWENRERIEPRFQGQSTPQFLEILKLLPRTNCGVCGEPTCTVFALRMSERAKDPEDCPPLDAGNSARLTEYLSRLEVES